MRTCVIVNASNTTSSAARSKRNGSIFGALFAELAEEFAGAGFGRLGWRSSTAPVAVWALQLCVCLGTAAARPPSTLWLAPPQLLMAVDLYRGPAVYAAATWVAMIALQVGVGHGLLDRTYPSAAAEPVAPQSVLLNVCITWDF